MGYVDNIRKALDEFEAAQGEIDSERRDIEAQRRECLITDRVAGRSWPPSLTGPQNRSQRLRGPFRRLARSI